MDYNDTSGDQIDAELDPQEVESSVPTKPMEGLTINSPNDDESGYVSVDPEEMRCPAAEQNMLYNMSSSPRGQLLIICNVTFDSKLVSRTGREPIETLKP